MLSQDVGRVPVQGDLQYDGRIPHIERTAPPPLPWYAPLVQQLAAPSQLRTRLISATIGLFALAFVCLNDGFFQGRLGSALRRVVGLLVARYRCDPNSV